MSFGKSSGSSAPVLTQEQKDAISAQTKMLTENIIPTYTGAVQGAKDIYNKNAGGVLNAAQNLGGTASKAQQTLGETGESALRTGISGLESLFNPNYEANQIQAALSPAQAAYAQNIAQQEAQFGGSGNLGSARQALAGRQAAGANQALMAKTAADTQAQIAQQRMAAANSLASLGQGGIGQALGAAGQQVSAAMTPQQLYNQYASVIFGTPAGSYTPDFRGTQGTNTTSMNIGGSLKGMFGGGG
mgnify:CR=1 FL=1|tara:strand:+ start:653 stop:1387 length:735 start_codon:yes stop_codon:yes gene_type:complete